MKKENLGTSLSFHLAPDILKEILQIKKSNQKVISFAAETETTREIFEEKMKRKPVDLMVGNKVANGLIGSVEIEGFQKSEGQFFFITSSSLSGPHLLSKKNVGEKLLEWFEGRPSW